MFRESNRRSAIKTISWRVLATLTTAALVYIFTGKLKIALYVGGIEVVLKMALYFLHERVWNNIRYGKKQLKPKIIWFTGLSGAGKTTIAEAVYKKIQAQGIKVEHLDGDKIREIFPKTGFSKEDRNRHIKRVGYLASMLEKNGISVVASFISPYKESRDFNRNLSGNFREVYVSTPLEVCEQRDLKGLYAKARKGEITQFTGIDDPYEIPEHPEITVDTSNQTVEESVKEVMDQLNFK